MSHGHSAVLAADIGSVKSWTRPVVLVSVYCVVDSLLGSSQLWCVCCASRSGANAMRTKYGTLLMTKEGPDIATDSAQLVHTCVSGILWHRESCRTTTKSKRNQRALLMSCCVHSIQIRPKRKSLEHC